MEHSISGKQFEMGQLKSLDLLTPQDKCIAIINGLKVACNDQGMTVGLVECHKILTSTKDMSHIDIEQQLEDAGGMGLDEQTSKWVKDTLTSTPSSLMAKPLKRSESKAPWAGRKSMAGQNLVEHALKQGLDINTVTRIKLQLKDMESWSFDIHSFHETTQGRPLYYLLLAAFQKYRFCDTLNVKSSKLQEFAAHVEASYCFDPSSPNVYHNAKHGADVLQTTLHLLTQERVSNALTSLDTFSLVIAAVMHDYRHKGVNNVFLVETRDPLALMHNDQSVLERHHAAEAFLLMKDDKYNIMSEFNKEDFKCVREAIVQVILATDLSRGFEYAGKFKKLYEDTVLEDAVFSRWSFPIGDAGVFNVASCFQGGKGAAHASLC
jgi:hypothetical protein